MRWLQALLLIIGNVVSGLMVVGVGLALFPSFTIFARDPNEHGASAWGSAYGIMFAFLFSALFGILLGLTHALTVIARSEGLLWHRPTWLGLLAGLALALPAAQIYPVMVTALCGTGSILHDLTDYAVGVMIFTVMLTTLCGYTGWIVAVAMASGRRWLSLEWMANNVEFCCGENARNEQRFGFPSARRMTDDKNSTDNCIHHALFVHAWKCAARLNRPERFFPSRSRHTSIHRSQNYTISITPVRVPLGYLSCRNAMVDRCGTSSTWADHTP